MTSFIFLLLFLAFFIIILALLQRFIPDKSHAIPSQLVKEIDQCLPQTQCGHCGYKGCLPYAEAVAKGEALNRCAPGGEETVVKLAKLLNRPYQPLDTHFRPPAVAFIREEECIGCTKCIQACPVDAIIGAAGFMHTVVEQDCTGCDLCVDACPVDCIDMVFTEAAKEEQEARTIADKARSGFEMRNLRIEKEQAELQEKRRQRQLAREKQQAELDPVAKALAEARNKVKTAENTVNESDTAPHDPHTLLRQRISKLEEQVKVAQSPAKEVIESTLAKMRQELADAIGESRD